MAYIGPAFVPGAQEASQDFAPIPSGEYSAMITDSDYKENNAKNGHYLELTFQIIDGPYKNRMVWARLNRDNPSAKAVEIANRDMESLCQAIGETRQVTDSATLHNRPMVIRVEFIPAGTPRKNSTPTQKDGNEVKAYKKLGANGAAATAGQAPAQAANNGAAPAAQPAAKPGWAKPAAA